MGKSKTGTRSFIQPVKETQVMAAASGKRGYFREKPNLDSGPSLHMRKKCNDSACLPALQLQKAAGKNHYGLEEFWSRCPVLRILEQT